VMAEDSNPPGEADKLGALIEGGLSAMRWFLVLLFLLPLAASNVRNRNKVDSEACDMWPVPVPLCLS